MGDLRIYDGAIVAEDDEGRELWVDLAGDGGERVCFETSWPLDAGGESICDDDRPLFTIGEVANIAKAIAEMADEAKVRDESEGAVEVVRRIREMFPNHEVDDSISYASIRYKVASIRVGYDATGVTSAQAQMHGVVCHSGDEMREMADTLRGVANDLDLVQRTFGVGGMPAGEEVRRG